MDSARGTLTDFADNKSPLDWVSFGFACLAIAEWLAFTIINLKTFLNVLMNPDKTTSVARAGFAILVYVVVRCGIFLPFYLVGAGIVLPYSGLYQPIIVKASITLLAIWWNCMLLAPLINIWYSRMRYGIGNTRLPDTHEPFNFVILLPVYNETIELLIEGVESIINSNFPADRIILHVSFDSPEVSDLYVALITHFGIKNERCVESVCTKVNKVTLWVHRFPHQGKRLTQGLTWAFIKKTMSGPMDKDRTILVFTDSDNYMYNNALHNLAKNFEKNEDKLAFAGYMTCMSSGGWKSLNPVRLLQDTEYVGGEMNRSFEILMGTVNCLPGGFTACRYGAFESVADTYFRDLADDTITDYHRNYLGEDRYLTHIMHQQFPRHSMGFCPSARCKTDPPTSFWKLVQQRRRWYLGALSNEAYMFVDTLIGKKYKFMILYKFFTFCWWRSSTFSQVVLGLIVMRDLDFSSWDNISSYIISLGIPLVISWIMIAITGIKIGHYKVIWMYPISHIPQAFIAFWVDMYTLATFYKRSWGGHRMVGVNAV